MANLDAQRIERADDLSTIFSGRLWGNEGPPSDILEDASRLDSFWDNNPKTWGFWQRWYDGFLSGKHLDWDLQYAVADLPSEDWDQGPDWIADKISEIEANFLGRRLPLAETISYSSDTGRLLAIPQPVAKPDLLGATLSQIADTLDDVIASPSNGMNERSREYIVLNRTITKYGNDPQRVEMDLTSVYGGIARQIVSDELPASEENLALQKALQEGAQGIRATHPEIAKNREILAGQALAELSDSDKETLAAAHPMLEEISEGQLREDWQEDIPFLLQNRHRVGPPMMGPVVRNEVLAGYNEKVRVFSRAAKIMMLLKSNPTLIKNMEASATSKLLQLLAAIITIGAWLF